MIRIGTLATLYATLNACFDKHISKLANILSLYMPKEYVELKVMGLFRINYCMLSRYNDPYIR